MGNQEKERLGLAVAQDASEQALVQLAARAKKYYEGSKAANTTAAYRSDFAHFNAFCANKGFGALPATPQVVALYLSYLADSGFKASTITRRVSSISQVHQHAGYESPTRNAHVRAVVAGIKRTIGSAEVGVSPVMDADLRLMLSCLRDGVIGVRDRALLLLGFTSAMRRSEIVALNVEDVQVLTEGLRIMIRRSKTDSEARGEVVAVPRGNHPETCVVEALEAWYRLSGIESGAIFRAVNRHGRIASERLSSKAVALVVKEMAGRIGLNGDRFAAHSLRSGFCTSAARAGVPERIIQLTTRHRSVQVLRRYIREGNLFTENAVRALNF